MLYQKTYKLEISDPAYEDLRNIMQYTHACYGEKQVDTYLQALYEGMGMLIENPKIGRYMDGEKYQVLNVKKHVLVFRVQENSVFIARVLHQGMDIERHL